MKQEILASVVHCLSGGVTLDSNLLLLLLVGDVLPARLESHKRLSIFIPPDYERLKEVRAC